MSFLWIWGPSFQSSGDGDGKNALLPASTSNGSRIRMGPIYDTSQVAYMSQKSAIIGMDERE
jgi:hypothetical protein